MYQRLELYYDLSFMPHIFPQQRIDLIRIQAESHTGARAHCIFSLWLNYLLLQRASSRVVTPEPSVPLKPNTLRTINSQTSPVALVRKKKKSTISKHRHTLTQDNSVRSCLAQKDRERTEKHEQLYLTLTKTNKNSQNRSSIVSSCSTWSNCGWAKAFCTAGAFPYRFNFTSSLFPLLCQTTLYQIPSCSLQMLIRAYGMYWI